MTKEQLDAIRARYADEPLLKEMRTDTLGNLITVNRENPVVALLAEVERLTGERDEAFRSREEARAYRDISEQALREESERHAATRSRVQAALVVLWERGRIARGMRAATAGTALADAVTEVFDRLDRARGAIERLHADPLPAAAWVREVERAAFARGVAAMREAAAQSLSFHSYADEIIRALPDPEDTE